MIFGIIGNTKKPHVREAIRHFTDFLENRQIAFIYAEDLVAFLQLDTLKVEALPVDQIGTACDMVIAFGGDGTILSTAIAVGQFGIPILGVNSGGLGFLTEVVVDDLQEIVDDLLSNNYAILERMVLRVELTKNISKNLYALNDVVIDKGVIPRLKMIDVKVNGRYLNTYRSDGVIIATPTGSTAYSLSAGGPLLEPTMHAILVTPICPHALTVRPIVLSDDSVMEVTVCEGQDPAHVNIDGQSRSQLNFGDKLVIRKADYVVRCVYTGRHDFFQLLRTKLNWGAENPGLNKNRTS
jgi:NAD+ kinase